MVFKHSGLRGLAVNLLVNGWQKLKFITKTSESGASDTKLGSTTVVETTPAPE